MGLDISHILDEWPYEGGQITARRIRGDDGRDKIQLRLDLGLLQMEVTGRPDGYRPYGFESLLSYYEHQLQRQAESGQQEGFQLDERACELLRAEALTYYHRYLAAFVLEDYDVVEADTDRNLKVMDFCTKYASENSDRFAMEQYRPYVRMMLARARARLALADNRPKVALAAVREAIADIREHFERFDRAATADSSREVAFLVALASEIESAIPVDPVTKLCKQLDTAIAEERYEDAAVIRDQLERVGHHPDADAPAEAKPEAQDGSPPDHPPAEPSDGKETG